MFTDYVWAFQLTGLLLTVAVVGAVVLARQRGGSGGEGDESVPDPTPEAVG